MLPQHPIKCRQVTLNITSFVWGNNKQWNTRILTRVMYYIFSYSALLFTCRRFSAAPTHKYGNKLIHKLSNKKRETKEIILVLTEN
jgi:hypothetical protein